VLNYQSNSDKNKFSYVQCYESELCRMDPSIFPEEIWIKILTYCDVKDILSCCSTCKYLNKVANLDYLW
jgi:hypothetical protein